MTETEIVKYGNEILRTEAEEIEEIDDEIRAAIEMMYKAMVEHRGVGVAGPQVGISKRIFVYDIGEGPHALINPKIVSASGEEWGAEGCLSIPGLQGDVPRATKLVVTGIDENGNKIKIKADGYLARVFQHEIDHLNGTMFIDRADPDTLQTIGADSDEEEYEE